MSIVAQPPLLGEAVAVGSLSGSLFSQIMPWADHPHTQLPATGLESQLHHLQGQLFVIPPRLGEGDPGGWRNAEALDLEAFARNDSPVHRSGEGGSQVVPSVPGQ